MEKTDLKFLSYDSSDVITASPFDYTVVEVNGDHYYFYGLGSDAVAPTGENILIRKSGTDVTGKYVDVVATQGKDGEDVYFSITNGNYRSYELHSSTGVEAVSQQDLITNGIADGAYDLEGNGKNFTPVQ